MYARILRKSMHFYVSNKIFRESNAFTIEVISRNIFGEKESIFFPVIF